MIFFIRLIKVFKHLSHFFFNFNLIFNYNFNFIFVGIEEVVKTVATHPRHGP